MEPSASSEPANRNRCAPSKVCRTSSFPLNVPCRCRKSPVAVAMLPRHRPSDCWRKSWPNQGSSSPKVRAQDRVSSPHWATSWARPRFQRTATWYSPGRSTSCQCPVSLVRERVPSKTGMDHSPGRASSGTKANSSWSLRINRVSPTHSPGMVTVVLSFRSKRRTPSVSVFSATDGSPEAQRESKTTTTAAAIMVVPNWEKPAIRGRT